ncbi:zinc finger, CCHC-type containing protein [Tanacetum coccineum]
MDWYRQLRIVLSAKDNLNYLELPILATPVLAVVGHQVPPETLAAHAAWVKGQKEIAVLMLMTMEPDLQRNLETLDAYDVLKELKTLFAYQAEQELLQTVREFHACKQEEGQSVSSYVLKINGYIDNLERLGHHMSLFLATVNELHAMLKLHKQTLPKRDAPVLHAIRARKIPPPPKKEDPAKDLVCHHCGDTFHWKWNCPQYLSELLKNKKLPQGASTSGIFTIELFTFPGKSWVYNTGCGTHIYNTTKGFKRSRKLKPGALSLYIGNGQRVAVEAIGSYDLCFPSGLVIVLHNCHYAPSITRGVISVSRLYGSLHVSQTTLPKSFWDYALKSATHILNMVPTKKVEKTPYELWYGQAPKLSYLKVWGCEETMSYSFYYPPENKVFVAQNAEFFENSLITQEASGSLKDLEIIQEEDTHPSENPSPHHDKDNQEIHELQSDIIPILRSTRIRHARDRMCLNIEANEYELGDLTKPGNYKAALSDPEFDKWLKAMNVEMQSMKDNEV